MTPTTQKTFKFFLKHIRQEKKLAILTMIGMTIGTIAQMCWPIIFGDFFKQLSTQATPEVTAPKLYAGLFLLAIVEATEWSGLRLFDYNYIRFQLKIMTKILNECFEYLHDHSYNFFNQNFTGALVKRINRLPRAFEVVMDRLIMDLYPMTIKLIIVIGTLLTIQPILGIIMIIWAIIFIFINQSLSNYKLGFDLLRNKADTAVTAQLADTITNNANIKLFAAKKYEHHQFKQTTEHWRKANHKSWSITISIEAVQAIFMIILEISILYFAIRFWEAGQINVGDFFIIQAYLIEMFRQFWRLGKHIRDIYEHLADANEMIEILEKPHEIQNIPGAKNLQVHSGKIEFKNVSFNYADQGESVIKKINLTIKPGEKVAIIGPSGGGKSTMTKLLLRLHNIQSGEILIDHQNIAQVTQESLRKNIALVPQDSILFHRTLFENIRYGRRNATAQEVIAASKLAHCHEFIQKFPKKYETYVGERGIRLSGGQRQRVAIARAILASTPILILDEATSSLDSESEILIQKALKNLMKQKTTIIIAHRLSTIMQSDRILVLDHGKVIEEGHHSDLINTKGSLYSKLWKLQVGGYLQ